MTDGYTAWFGGRLQSLGRNFRPGEAGIQGTRPVGDSQAFSSFSAAVITATPAVPATNRRTPRLPLVTVVPPSSVTRPMDGPP